MLPIYRVLLLTAIILVIAGCESPGGDTAAEPEHNNVILISIDTLRADHLGCYGYQRPTSPTLDRLASEGVVFEDVSSTSPWTLPAHASLLTGLYLNRHGVRSIRSYLPESAVTIAQQLEKHGYATAAFVNSLYFKKRFRLNRGFETYTYLPEDVAQRMPSKIADVASQWLSEQAREPFFLFLHFYDVHSDYRSLPHYERLFVRPYTGIADGTTRQLVRYRADEISLNYEDAQHLIDLYDAGIRQLDYQIAKLLDELKENKLYERSIIIVTSDHGEEFLEHEGVLHGQTQFQELINVPLIMRGPGIPTGKRIKPPTSLVDVLPTTMALIDLPFSEDLDGIDLSSLWGNQPVDTSGRVIFAEADHNNIKHDIKRAVRMDRFKLHYDLLTEEMELYDLVNDPDEKVNLVGERPSVVGLMREKLDEFMNTTVTAQPLDRLSDEEIKKLKGLGYLD